MIFSGTTLSLLDIIIYLIVFWAIKRIYFELTTGAARRAIIKEHGCKPVYHWQHQGILGRLFGLDLIREFTEDDRNGRTYEGARLRFFSDRNTVQVTNPFMEGQFP